MDFPEHKLIYSSDMVCRECGSNNWHIGITYNNRNGGWYYGEFDEMGLNGDEDVWCGECETWRELISPEEVN